VGESAIGGLVGSLVGVAAGYALAGAVARVIDRMLAGMQGVSQGPSEIGVEPWLAGLALVLGTGTSVIAAALPAWQASRVDPVKALQRGRVQAFGERENRVRTSSRSPSARSVPSSLTRSGSLSLCRLPVRAVCGAALPEAVALAQRPAGLGWRDPSRARWPPTA
jgi:putative ABC transport system permease protein